MRTIPTATARPSPSPRPSSRSCSWPRPWASPWPPTEQITAAAGQVAGVRAIEKLWVRKVGTNYFVDLHVQADPMLPLRDAHILSGKVKAAIRSAVPSVAGVLVHMEPFEDGANKG